MILPMSERSLQVASLSTLVEAEDCVENRLREILERLPEICDSVGGSKVVAPPITRAASAEEPVGVINRGDPGLTTDVSLS